MQSDMDLSENWRTDAFALPLTQVWSGEPFIETIKHNY